VLILAYRVYFAGYKLHVRGALPERNDMLWDILWDFHVMEHFADKKQHVQCTSR